MRQKRAKTYKRVMALYTQTFNFRQPFQVLVSEDVLTSPGAASLDIFKGLADCVQGEIKPMITQCTIETLYKLPPTPSTKTLIFQAKKMERRHCNHRTAIPSTQCLQETIGPTNKHRYILASQSSELRLWANGIVGLPFIHFNPRGVLVLAPLSVATVRDKNFREEERRKVGRGELESLVDGGNVLGGVTVSGGGQGSAGPSDITGSGGNVAGQLGGAKQRSRVKAPNPLSMKKKKTTTTTSNKSGKPQEGNDGVVGKKRARFETQEEDGNESDDDEEREEEGGKEVGGQSGEVEGEARRKKKRKRRGKGVVAAAIAEIQAERMAGNGVGEESVADGDSGSDEGESS